MGPFSTAVLVVSLPLPSRLLLLVLLTLVTTSLLLVVIFSLLFLAASSVSSPVTVRPVGLHLRPVVVRHDALSVRQKFLIDLSGVLPVVPFRVLVLHFAHVNDSIAFALLGGRRRCRESATLTTSTKTPLFCPGNIICLGAGPPGRRHVRHERPRGGSGAPSRFLRGHHQRRAGEISISLGLATAASARAAAGALRRRIRVDALPEAAGHALFLPLHALEQVLRPAS